MRIEPSDSNEVFSFAKETSTQGVSLILTQIAKPDWKLTLTLDTQELLQLLSQIDKQVDLFVYELEAQLEDYKNRLPG